MLSKIQWVWDRWKLMEHPREEVYRIKQQIQYHIIDRLWYFRPPLKNNFSYNKDRFVLAGLSIEGLQQVISGAEDPERFRLLNTYIPNIINNTYWNYDFKNGKQGQRKFVHQIDDFNIELGEIKYVYELSRLYYVPVLTAYAMATGKGNLLRHVEKQLRAWYEQNRFLETIAWKSGNVVGIRAVNLIVCRALLSLADYDCTAIDEFLNPLIELHYRFLTTHLSLYSSRGNHHIGELAGLIAISAAYRFPDSDKVLKSCLKELETETLRLIHKDGFNKEQATRYQASYINLIVTSFRLVHSLGWHPSTEVINRISAMYGFLNSLRVGSREFLHVGDDDNAELIYPYFDKEYDEYESMLNDAVVWFGNPKKKDYHFDLRNYILWGDEGWMKWSNAITDDVSPDLYKLYADSGYFLVKDKRVALLFDVGEIGIKPTMCHGHSDILNVILYIDGKPILVDCGSYQYNAHFKRMREYFHGVHSHNTISIDHLDQAVAGSGMFWLSYPKVDVVECSESEKNPWCMAQHDGYCRNNKTVVHSRKVGYNPDEKRIMICDTLSAHENHDAYFYLHFHPQARVVHDGNKLAVDGKVTLVNPLFTHGELVSGNEERPLGWYSERYDALEATCAFVLHVSLRQHEEIVTEIRF